MSYTDKIKYMFFKNRNFKFMFVYVFLFVTTFLVGGFFIANVAKASGVTITSATGGTTISADTATGTFTSLTGPIIEESSVHDVGLGTIILTAPIGFTFNTSDVTASVTNENNSLCPGTNRTPLLLNDGSTQTVTPTDTTITINVVQQSSGSTTCHATITYNGIQVRPSAGTPLASGNITKSGTATIVGTNNATNFGTLTEIAGTPIFSTFTLTYTANANGSITGTSPQTIDQGLAGSEIIAVPNTGYHFTNWSDGVQTATRTDTNVIGNISATANFAVTLSSTQIAAASTVLVNTTQKEVMVNSTAPTTITIPENVIDSKINVNSLVSIVGTEKTATLPAITLNVATSLSTTNVEVKIPTGTVVTAPTGWDGTINAPTIKENSTVTATPDSGMTSTVSSVIEVGYGDVKLTFDKAVRILIPGQAGKFAGYSRGGVFTEITSVCAADNQTTGDALPAEGDCKIDVGSDMIIWTKHFTTFATYTQSASRTSGGGSYYIRPVVALAPVVTPTTAVGKVLGVEKFNFTKFLKFKALSYKVSLQGAEVMELQKLLNNFGSTLIIDGKFGPKTKGAVVKFQKANKLVGDGIVGTKTRAELNK